MSVENPTGAPPAATTPAGQGSPANEPSVSIDDLAAKLADVLEPRFQKSITGATARHAASLREEFTDALKGIADASKTGDDGKVNPEKVKLSELNERFKSLEAENARNHARAIKGAVSEAVASAKVTASARELLISALSAQAREDDQGNLYIGDKDTPTPLGEYLKSYLKGKDDLLESTARSGSGAGKPASTFTGDAPKSKLDVLYTQKKNPYTGKMDKVATPDRQDAFIAAYGRAAFDALPDA